MVFVIDPAFLQVRPSPWRQAVDLANMMLVLAIGTDAERVYRKALRFFTPEEIAEAFAAARGMASPTQLRSALRRDGRDLVGQFRALAPPRPPIAVQRWSMRRVALTLGVLFAVLFALVIGFSLVRPAQDLGVSAEPACGTGNAMVLVAQSVPSATRLPCIASLPSGWSFTGAQVHSNRARFWLGLERGSGRTVEVTLSSPGACRLRGSREYPSDEVGTRRYDRPESIRPNVVVDRFYLFRGGCVTYHVSLARSADPSLLFDVDAALGFEERSLVVESVRERSGLQLCGAGVECPG
jgi:hypothetical protein